MNRAIRHLLYTATALPFLWPVASLLAQSQSQTSPPSPSSQSQPAQSQAQQQKEDSVAEAARKAKEKKAAPAQHKVFTDEDLSGMRKEGVSVVGGEARKDPEPARAANPKGNDDQNGEEYWRKKAHPILGQIAAVDQQIDQLKEDIKKYGNGGIDVTTGMRDGIAYVHDRNGQIEKLEKKKTDLQKQLDDLQEEGRKAGADPAWFR